MSKSVLTGTRIRARRMALGMRQADLARAVGMSPSYLNLIEHNRRRATPEVVSALAGSLDVPAETLTEGSGGAMVQGLRAVAALSDPGTAAVPEVERIDEFLGRFPGWAAALASAHSRAEGLERTVEHLSDRMTHDPYLSAALHEIVSAVTSVQSTAAILADTDDIDPVWQRKFHANILQDSVRLADGAEALVSYLDSTGAQETGLAAPQEELEAWLAARGYHIAALEGDTAPDIAQLLSGEIDLASKAARDLAAQWLIRYRADAQALPLDAVLSALHADPGIPPDALAARFNAPLDAVLRRLAYLPQGAGLPRFGLLICDRSGTLTARRPIDGFAVPRFGGACPLWPLYQALAQPYAALRTPVVTAARVPQRFIAYSYACARGPAQFGVASVVDAVMLLTPDSAAPTPDALSVGPSCRICARHTCPARREPSILADMPGPLPV
ncbi:XRE family transcriptional regulator [Roseicitreum antarcticum]|uniref:HTH cro/C1-type domain-containing protein n=1 Tax=Roseicitreum antarcticum TaxID=564137 RepID=A0A1H3C667_9RHOB|nr:XRE family transcriptional regulator [Roseicitreum antarcticum]SDX49565.1 hypothetical protein SAMN04488238_10936 [Roseicitreum antarcticum]